MINQLKEQLGHALPAANSVTDLNTVPDEIIADLRSLRGALKVGYLRHLLAPSEYPAAGMFMTDCVDGELPVERFGRGRVVVLGIEPDEIFVTPLEDALARLASLSDLPLGIRDFAPVNRHNRGAPVAIMPHVDYRWTAPKDMCALYWPVWTLPVEDPVLAGRRWLATLIGFYAKAVDDPATHAPALLRQLAPNAASFSEDALIAARAWLVLKGESAQALGARGEDSLFEG